MSAPFASADEFKGSCGYTIDDSWYPRVTRIVSIKAKPGLANFYSQVGSKAGQAISEEAAREGTMVHEAVESLILGQKPVIPEIVRPAVRAFENFRTQHDIEVAPDGVERRILNRGHRYAGTVDVIARVDGKLGVLDIKTSQAIYRDYNLQTAAYMDALKGEFEDLETRWILRIDQSQMCLHCGSKRRVKGGREKIRPNGRASCQANEHFWSDTMGEIQFQEFSSWQSDFEAFLGAKKLWEWENEYWLRKVGYL